MLRAKSIAGEVIARRRRSRWLGAAASLAAGLAATGLVAAGAPAPDGPLLDQHPNALWRVVHDLCVPDRLILGLSAPCMAVNLRQGWAVVKDTREPTHILLVPTHRISGIESPALLAPEAPNYWEDAWRARSHFERLVGRPVARSDFGMAINSRFGRTQDQLHIHVDCLWPQVARALREATPHVGAAWAPLGVPLLGDSYEARRIDGEDLTRDPFKLLASGDPEARADMGAYGLAAVGEVFPDGQPGFILLARRADLPHGVRGAVEGILDHKCRVLNAGAGAPGPG
jgi:CDP-diacylglycerol pyrophosphatase